MNPAIAAFWRDYRHVVPFFLLMATSLFLSTAGHRVVFYLMCPLMIATLVSFRDSLPAYLRTFSGGMFLAYIAYFFVSLLWSPHNDGEISMKALRDAACLLVFVSALALVLGLPKKDQMTFPKIAIGFAVSVAAFSLIYLLLFFLDDSAFGSQRFVGIGRYKNPIHMAFLLSVAVLMLVSMSDWSNKALQVLRYFLIFFLLIFIALTETRSAFVALAGCIMVLPLIGRWKIAAGLFGGACLAAFLAFLVWDFSANDVFSRLDNYRFGLWGNALQDALERPVFGYGIAIEPKFFPNKLVPEGLKSAHNALIGHFYTGGIIGLALYMAMVANMVWQGWVAYVRAKDNGGDAYSLPLLALLLTCFMFCASFFNFTHYMLHLHIQWLVFWVPFAICWHLEMENRKAVISSNLSSQGV